MPILDPNLAFIFLVIGLLFAIFAILTPGTGLIELGSIFMILLAGYGIVSSPTNYWAFIFLVLAFPFLFLFRIKKKNSWLVLGIISLNLGAFCIFRGTDKLFSVSVVLAVIVSIIDSILLWFVIKKMVEAMDQAPVFNTQSIIGKVGEARSQVFHEGSVYVGGEEWSARSSVVIKKGSLVKVTKIEGLILEVEAIE